jgi:hypothetical protein
MIFIEWSGAARKPELFSPNMSRQDVKPLPSGLKEPIISSSDVTRITLYCHQQKTKIREHHERQSEDRRSSNESCHNAK